MHLDQVPPLFEQLVVTVSAFGLKPLHMILSAVLIAWLWRSKAPDLVLIRRALAVFLVGESCCAIEFLVFGGEQEALELIHGMGLVAFGALLPWGLFKMIDERVVRYTAPDRSCAVQRLCGHCWKRQDVSCGLHRLWLVVLGLLALVALTPLSVEVDAWSSGRLVFGTEASFVASDSARFLELRGYPIAAAILFGIALGLAWRGREGLRKAELPMFAGVGFLCFSLTRFFLREVYAEHPPWADAWEEITELMIVGIVAVLLFSFRRPLGLSGKSEPSGRP